jgi:amidohydrolase
MLASAGNSSIDNARVATVAAIEQNADSLKLLSRYIHANPEPALEEEKASKACADFLIARGFQVERGVAGLPTAFSANFGAGEPRVAYLSEYDALPGVGHGCGHNLIAISGIGAGIGLAAAIAELDGNGRVEVFGTPAEESVGGKIIMANAGLFQSIDAALGAHPGTAEAVCPTVEGSGQALACVLVRISYRGRSAHAAADPENGINALNAVIEVFNGINAFRQHMPLDGRIHGIITRGGDIPNVVPDFAVAEFYVRASTVARMNGLVEQVRRICEGAASITGATLTFELPEEPNWDMITNYALARRLAEHMAEAGLDLPTAKAEPGKGSTDWGNVSYVTPSVETSYPILNRVCTWHSQDVVEASVSELGEENTLKVAKAMALTGVDLITDPVLLASVKSEFSQALQARAR